MKARRVGIFIQARSNSSRLSNKIYKGLPGKQDAALLEHIYRRLSMISNGFLTVVLAPAEDQRLVAWCQDRQLPVFCGPGEDVRERYRQAALHFGVDVVVRATGDNPCVDPDIARETVAGFYSTQADLFSFGNLPLGIAVEVFSTEALMSNTISDTAEHREHVSVHIKQNPKLFICCHPDHKIIENFNKAGSLPRLTVDTPEDLEVLQTVFARLGSDFRLSDILRLYLRCPEIFQINRNIEQIKVTVLAS